MITLVVEGVPIPWKAPHVGEHHTFSPRYREKAQIQWQIKSQWNQAPITAPIWCEFTFHMPIPKGTSKAKRIQMLNGIITPAKRPDRTNLLKLYEDCLNGIVIADDGQIVAGPVNKIYSEFPKTVIKIIEISKYTIGRIP